MVITLITPPGTVLFDNVVKTHSVQAMIPMVSALKYLCFHFCNICYISDISYNVLINCNCMLSFNVRSDSIFRVL